MRLLTKLENFFLYLSLLFPDLYFFIKVYFLQLRQLFLLLLSFFLLLLFFFLRFSIFLLRSLLGNFPHAQLWEKKILLKKKPFKWKKWKKKSFRQSFTFFSRNVRTPSLNYCHTKKRFVPIHGKSGHEKKARHVFHGEFHMVWPKCYRCCVLRFEEANFPPNLC